MKRIMSLGNQVLKDVFKLGMEVNGKETPLRSGIMNNDMDLVNYGNLILFEHDKVYNIYTDIIVHATDISKIDITLNINPNLVAIGILFKFTFVAVEETQDDEGGALCRLILVPHFTADTILNRGEGLCTVVVEYDDINIPLFIEERIQNTMNAFAEGIDDEDDDTFKEAPKFNFAQDEKIFDQMETEYSEQQEKLKEIEESQGGSVFGGEE